MLRAVRSDNAVTGGARPTKHVALEERQRLVILTNLVQVPRPQALMVARVVNKPVGW